MVAPPLILLANPVPILVWGAGGSSRSHAGTLLAPGSVIGRLRYFFGGMPVAWSLYVVNLWAWHYPVLYDAALRIPWIHDVEHLLFFLTALMFWWPVIRPASRPAPVQDGLRIFYLFLAATQDALLSGLIALSTRILYPHYQTVVRLWDLTPREDQIGAGIIMFAVGSTTYAVAILFLVNALLGAGRRNRSTKGAPRDSAEKVEGRV
jgi:cytochrome c oxidase assembly factor CtaG